MEEISAYLGGVPAHHALTDAGCADVVNEIEMLGVLKEMRAAGVEIRCVPGGRFTSATQLREVFEHLPNWEDTRAEGPAPL